ncbi:MAG: OmpA family protein [Candidatus Methylumidiphilus sp.]|nr:OmpA family protein [Pseudomonadota bacterium]
MKKTAIPLLLAAAVVLPGCVSQKTYNRDMGAERQINQELMTEVQADTVKIIQLQDRLRVTLVDELLFSEGGWELHSNGKAVLDKIVPALQSATTQRIEVEGYTDNVPIGAHLQHRFPTNWELSAARAAEVVRYLQKKGIDPSRLTAAGHGEYQPVGSNATPAGRQANRRTDIDLMPINPQ